MSLSRLVYIDHLEAFRRPNRDDLSDDLSRAVPNGASGLATESGRTVPSTERCVGYDRSVRDKT